MWQVSVDHTIKTNRISKLKIIYVTIDLSLVFSRLHYHTAVFRVGLSDIVWFNV